MKNLLHVLITLSVITKSSRQSCFSRPRRSLNTRQIGQYKLVDPVIQTTEIEKNLFKTLFLKNHWSEVLKRAWKHPHVGVDSIYDPQK